MECPRWRLTEPHYLNVPVLPDGTKVEWEHKETAKETGRTKRVMYAVPMLLDPKDPADHNHPGEIIVALEVEDASHVRNDIIFIGTPTPGMEPLNEEAEAITAEWRKRWDHPIESLAPNGEMSDAESAFMERMMSAFGKIADAASVPNATVPKAEYDELKERLAKLEAALAAKVTEAPSAAPAGRRA